MGKGTTNNRRVLERYVERSKWIGIASFPIAIILIIIGDRLGSDVGTVVTAVGGSLIPVAIINAILDPLLKDEAARDLIEVMRIRDSVSGVGLQEVEETHRVQLQDRIGLSQSVSVVPRNPLLWGQRDLPALLRLSSVRPLELKIYLPAPDESTMKSLAARLNEDEEALASKIIRLPDEYAAAWDQGVRHEGSRLEVFYVAGVPAQGILSSHAVVIVEIGSTLRDNTMTGPTYALSFDAAGPVGEWVKDQFEFRDSPTPPTPAQVRPLNNGGQPVSTGAKVSSTYDPKGNAS